MSACLSGCTSLGTHKASCTGFGDSGMDCRGCTPREAVEGDLCARCWGNLQRDVRTAPSIVDWIREHVEPSSQWGERINSGEVDAPAPLSVTAVDDADELHACLASWALLILEEHPSQLAGPKVERQWRTGDGTVVGLRGGKTTTTEDEPDRSEPRFGHARPRPQLIPGFQRGERCALSDLLTTQCACGNHEESA